MNANEIVKNKVSRIKWRLCPSWGQDEDIYTWKSDRLSRPRVLPPNIQQGLLGTGHVWPPNWWSMWSYCMGQLFLGRGHVSDNCSASLAFVARPCQLGCVPASCDCTGRGLPVVIVRRTWHARSFCLVACWAAQTDSWPGRLASDLVDGPLKILRLARGGRLGTPIS